MANLKNLIVNGAARVLGNIYGNLVGNVTGNCSGSSGSCTGNAATATKATSDGSGNNIVNTYQKKLTAGTNITISGTTISATGGGSTVSYNSTTETLIFS